MRREKESDLYLRILMVRQDNIFGGVAGFFGTTKMYLQAVLNTRIKPNNNS